MKDKKDLIFDICESQFTKVEKPEKSDLVLCTVQCKGMGPFGEKNRNDRVYPVEIATESILKNEYVIEMLKNKTLLGEPHHPEREEVWCNEVSHSITSMWMSNDNKYLMIEFDVLDTPMGRIIKDLLDYGCNLAVSARATGKVDMVGDHFEVSVEDYDFKTFDIVTNPGFLSARFTDLEEEKKPSFADDVRFVMESASPVELNNLRNIVGYCSDPEVGSLLEAIDNKLNSFQKRPNKEVLNEGSIKDTKNEKSLYWGEITQLKAEIKTLTSQRDTLMSILENRTYKKPKKQSASKVVKESKKDKSDASTDWLNSGSNSYISLNLNNEFVNEGSLNNIDYSVNESLYQKPLADKETIKRNQEKQTMSLIQRLGGH